jgi:hypothetical protein
MNLGMPHIRETWEYRYELVPTQALFARERVNRLSCALVIVIVKKVFLKLSQVSGIHNLKQRNSPRNAYCCQEISSISLLR